MSDNKGKENIAKEMLEFVEHDIHGYVQQELVDLKDCAPDREAKKKYFKKNVSAYYRAINDTVTTEQKIKAGGYGHASTKNLTINLSGLGLADKQKLLAEMTEELKGIGEKMGYGSKKVIEAVGENRINNDGDC